MPWRFRSLPAASRRPGHSREVRHGGASHRLRTLLHRPARPHRPTRRPGRTGVSPATLVATTTAASAAAAPAAAAADDDHKCHDHGDDNQSSCNEQPPVSHVTPLFAFAKPRTRAGLPQMVGTRIVEMRWPGRMQVWGVWGCGHHRLTRTLLTVQGTVETALMASEGSRGGRLLRPHDTLVIETRRTPRLWTQLAFTTNKRPTSAILVLRATTHRRRSAACTVPNPECGLTYLATP